MKIFQIGFNKCATTSIHERLLNLGLRSVHHTCNKLKKPVAKVMQENKTSGRKILSRLSGYDAYTDLVFIDRHEHVEAFKYYADFLVEVPNARFILNLRNKDEWLNSCARHPGYFERLKTVYRLSSDQSVKSFLSENWDNHILNVRASIPSSQLLEYDIDTDDARDIDRFVDRKPLKTVELGRHNVTADRSIDVSMDANSKKSRMSYHRLLRIKRRWLG